jgi:D-amino-acid dehydrogenase
MKRSAAAGFSDWDDTAEHTAPWAGLRPMTPDGLPVVGPLPGLANVLVASGHGLLGLTRAPSTAKAIASLARGDSPNDLLRSISPHRFGKSRGR